MSEDAGMRVGLVGAVRHAGSYTEIVHNAGLGRIVAVYEEPDQPEQAQNAAKSLASAWSVPHIANLGELTDQVDCVLVCTEPTRHARAAQACLNQGLHTIVDKPVATNEKDLGALVKTAERSGKLCGAITRSLAPAIEQAVQRVDAGYIGFPRSANAEFLSSGSRVAESVERLDLVVDPSLAGGGEIMNFLGYPIDNIRRLTGCEPIQIHTESGALFSEPHARHGVEDTTVISAEFTNGLVASIVVGRVPYPPTTGPVTSTTRIFGSHGHLVIDEERPLIRRFGPDGETTHPIVGDPNTAPITHYLETAFTCIRDGSPLSYDLHDAAVAVRSILAAYQSVATGQPAKVRNES